VRAIALALALFAAPALHAEEAAAPPGPDLAVMKTKLDELAAKAGFTGELAMNANGGGVTTNYGLPFQKTAYRWRWASVTKQLVAVLVMQEVSKGRIKLDAPISTYLPRFKSPNATKISVRQLLRHQSGLPNPDDVQASSIEASAYYFPFYKGNRDPLTGYCAGTPKGEPGKGWAYNNCDYIVAGALLKAVTGKTWDRLVQERIAKPMKLRTVGAFPTKEATVDGKIGPMKEPPFDLATFGAAGALYGTAADLIWFDFGLMNGLLMPEAQLKEMWDGQAELGYIALGQWVFEAQPEGCAKPVRIVERRGAIGGVQVRNFMLPDMNRVAVAFSNNGSFDFGEIWQGQGFAHDYLSLVACS
jgi:D-alanyl-D-alanine carboxypeptidase